MVIFSPTNAKDEFGVLHLADEAKRIDSNCVYALVVDQENVLNLVAKVMEGFHSASVFSLCQSNCNLEVEATSGLALIGFYTNIRKSPGKASVQ